MTLPSGSGNPFNLRPADLNRHVRRTPAAFDLSNVVPFKRPGASLTVAPPVAATEGDHSIASPEAGQGTGRIAAFLLLSALAHAGIYAAFDRPPPPQASVGEIAISVEIVLGSEHAAGLSQRPAETEATDAAASNPSQPQRAAEMPSEKVAALPLPQPEPKPEESKTEVAKVEPEPPPVTPEAQPLAAAPTEEKKPEEAKPEEPKPEEPRPPVKTEKPKPDEKAEKPKPEDLQAAELKVEEPKPADEKPAEPEQPPPTKPAPEPVVRITQPPPEPPPSEKKEPVPEKPAAQKPERAEQTPSRAATASQASESSSGIGRGVSDADTNYRGRVAAHLARHKRFPEEARQRRERGRTIVKFTLDGSGRVQNVAIERSSGIRSLDEASEAMIRRASPFPAPPNGQPMVFTVPVSFQIR